jgi:hypothetical protein
MARHRIDDAYASSSSEAARARERMTEARGRHGREMSRRSRLIVGWTIALLFLGFLVAALAGFIEILPS